MQVADVPEELAAMAVGPGLAAALDALALPQVPNDCMLDVLGAQYRQLCHEQARMAAALTELSRCSRVPGPGQVARDDAPGRYASAETRAALHWTRHAADTEHDIAESIVHAMPLLFAAWLSGAVDRPRVNLFDLYLTGLTPEQVLADAALNGDPPCQPALLQVARMTQPWLQSFGRNQVHEYSGWRGRLRASSWS